MIIFGMESSCDETSAAVARCEGESIELLSNIVATQIETHARYGGVVPEIASRAHAEAVCEVADRAVREAGISFDNIDAVAVTVAPGLIGSLLVGVNYAKSLAFSLGVPLVPVNHMKAHAAASYFKYPEIKPPYYAVIVSGSHTSLYAVDSFTDFRELGASRDDAAGEAFDKVGRVLGLHYPCGADMDKLATEGAAQEPIALPSPALRDGSLDFSFSGLKTAVINHVHTTKQRMSLSDDDELPRDEVLRVASSFSNVVCRAVADKVTALMEQNGARDVVLAGGVAANSHLRAALADVCERRGVRFYVPDASLCGDNGAMVAAQGYFEYLAGRRASTSLNAYASEEAATMAGVIG